LVIENVWAQCGCTIPDYPKEPIQPGKEGVITALFNSLGQSPTVHKTVSVVANAIDSNPKKLTFTGEVKQNQIHTDNE
jgi:hypothetical protein